MSRVGQHLGNESDLHRFDCFTSACSEYAKLWKLFASGCPERTKLHAANGDAKLLHESHAMREKYQRFWWTCPCLQELFPHM